jgi:hypothetical protein
MTRNERRRFEELLDRHDRNLVQLCYSRRDTAHINRVANRLLARLFRRLDREIPHTSTLKARAKPCMS